MNKVHGTFTNFKDMAVALGVKIPKTKEEKAMKCSISLRQVILTSSLRQSRAIKR